MPAHTFVHHVHALRINLNPFSRSIVRGYVLALWHFGEMDGSWTPVVEIYRLLVLTSAIHFLASGFTTARSNIPRFRSRTSKHHSPCNKHQFQSCTRKRSCKMAGRSPPGRRALAGPRACRQLWLWASPWSRRARWCRGRSGRSWAGQTRSVAMTRGDRESHCILGAVKARHRRGLCGFWDIEWVCRQREVFFSTDSPEVL